MAEMLMDDPRRASLEARVMERLQQLDDSTLHELDEWLTQPGPEGQPEAGRRGMTRRQLLAASLLSGAAVAGAGVAGNVVGQQAGQNEGEAAASARVEEMAGTVEEWRGEAEALGERFDVAQQVLGLYEQMDGVGLDKAISTGLGVVAASVGRTAQSAQSLREGLARARENIDELDENLAILDQGLVRVEGVVTGLSEMVQGLEDRLEAAGEPVEPITDALGSFFAGLIGKIPFGVGDRILATVERIQTVVGAIPESIANINDDLIEPLRAKFFPRDGEGEDVTVRLIEPLTDLIFTPADRMLSNLANLGETWQTALEEPAREKIAERDALRKEIQQLRSENDL